MICAPLTTYFKATLKMSSVNSLLEVIWGEPSEKVNLEHKQT